MNKPVSGAIGIEIELTPNTDKIYLPNLAQLRGKRIKHIDVCNIPLTPSAKTVYNNFIHIFMTLVENNSQQELIRNLPLTLLNSDMNRLFINKIIDLQHSYIEISNVPAEHRGKYIYFVIWFDEPEVWGFFPNNLNRTEIHPQEITLTGMRTYFNVNRSIVDKRIQNIILSFPVFTPKGNAGILQENIKNKFITLKRGQSEFFRQVPLYLLAQTENAFTLRFQNIICDWQNSYIDSLTTTADDLKSVFFNVIVDDNKKKPVPGIILQPRRN